MRKRKVEEEHGRGGKLKRKIEEEEYRKEARRKINIEEEYSKRKSKERTQRRWNIEGEEHCRRGI